MVNILLETSPVEVCIAGDLCGDGRITVDEIVLAVRALLLGCPFPVSPDRCALEKLSGPLQLHVAE